MPAVNIGWTNAQATMAEAFRVDGPHAALAAGEAFAATIHPMRVEGFRLRDAIFKQLAQHRRSHDINLVSHLTWAAPKRWDDGHPLGTVLHYNLELSKTHDLDARGRLMASRAKVLFSMGWVTEAERAYHSALEISECPPARLGKAAVLRHRMYQMPNGIMRRDLWEQAMELVEEANDLEPSMIGIQMLDSLKGDERWL